MKLSAPTLATLSAIIFAISTFAGLGALALAEAGIAPARGQTIECNQGGTPHVVRGRACIAKTGGPPSWALGIANKQWGAIVAPTDGIWQHAICDEQTHTITWCFP